jgi:hypothetical protein
MTIEADIGHALPISSSQLRSLADAVRARAPNLRLERFLTETGEPYIYVSRRKIPARIKHRNPTTLAVWYETVPRDELVTFILCVENGWQVFALDGEPYRTFGSVEEAAEFLGSLKGPIVTGAPQ